MRGINCDNVRIVSYVSRLIGCNCIVDIMLDSQIDAYYCSLAQQYLTFSTYDMNKYLLACPNISPAEYSKSA